MNVISTVADLQKTISEQGQNPVGLVPTMGALHPGHLSLVQSAVTECPLVVVSIFVNPTQFNDKNDLKNYPRDMESDLGMLSAVLRPGDIVFTPSEDEIYPGEDNRQFSFGNLDNVMEALHRPGHFNGVAQVVSRLFSIVKPDLAWFGLKDFQQVAVIKELVRQTGDKVKIIPRPVIREKDGLAMSSRNSLLDPELRKKAPVIYRTLSAAAAMIGGKDIPEIKSFVENEINSENDFSIEYFEIADDEKLIPVKNKSEMEKGKHYYGCIAVKAGNIRLIDNIEIKHF
ncbi:MAG TPA: pantoate--beta-alanine ligase [Bacteroidales bacterium]|nr:pantoate--beta-alanine ligase [Bacteroidales bacterium]